MVVSNFFALKIWSGTGEWAITFVLSSTLFSSSINMVLSPVSCTFMKRPLCSPGGTYSIWVFFMKGREVLFIAEPLLDLRVFSSQIYLASSKLSLASSSYLSRSTKELVFGPFLSFICSKRLLKSFSS